MIRALLIVVRMYVFFGGCFAVGLAAARVGLSHKYAAAREGFARGAREGKYPATRLMGRIGAFGSPEVSWWSVQTLRGLLISVFLWPWFPIASLRSYKATGL